MSGDTLAWVVMSGLGGFVLGLACMFLIVWVQQR